MSPAYSDEFSKNKVVHERFASFLDAGKSIILYQFFVNSPKFFW